MALDLAVNGIAGYLNNTDEARTSRATEFSKNESHNSIERQRKLTDGQWEINDDLTATALERIRNPGKMLQPYHTAARQNVNANFAGMDDTLRGKYGAAAGRSGKMGKATRQTEIARRTALGGADTEFSKLILQMQESGIGLGERLLKNDYANVQFGGSSGWTDSNSTSTAAGNATGAMLGSMGAVLSSMTMMNAMMAGG